MPRFLHILTLCSLLSAAVTAPSRVDARKLAVVAIDDTGLASEFVRALEAQSEVRLPVMLRSPAASDP